MYLTPYGRFQPPTDFACEDHWSLFLEFELDGDHGLQKDTITCPFAG